MNQSTDQRALEHVDVGSQRVAHVYAEALLNEAERRQEALPVLEDLEGLVHDVFSRDPHFEAFLGSGAMGRERKAEAIHKAFEGRASPVLVDFLLVLNSHDRLDLLRPLVVAYRNTYDDRAGRMRVKVRSAVPLPEDQQESLRDQLRQTYHKDPILETTVDPELIGGLVVQIGDLLYDVSVRTRLELLRKQILERSSHEIQSGRDRFSSPIGD